MYFKRCSKVLFKVYLKFKITVTYRLRNQIVNKIIQKIRIHSAAAVNAESDNSPNV